MESRIEIFPEKKLVGMHINMSLTNNRTAELWQKFMSRRKEITNSTGSDLYSIQIYKPLHFTHFNPASEFEKWAAIEVSDVEHVPEGMETLIINEGLYAVFLHKGPASTGAASFRYIFETWLPQADYVLDQRPHFEVLGSKYKNEEPDSEEEIWIPVMPKANAGLLK